MEFLRGKKTYLVSGLMMLVSLIHLLTGEMTLVEFVSSPHLNTFLEGTAISTLRAGMQNSGGGVIQEVVKKINNPHAG